LGRLTLARDIKRLELDSAVPIALFSPDWRGQIDFETREDDSNTM